jgi:hypothetical protein
MEGGKGLRAAARGCRGNSLGRNSDSPRRAAIAGSARCDSREARQASGDRQLMMAVTQILRKKLVRTVQTLAALALVMGHSAGLAQGSAPIDGDLAAPTTAAPPPTNPAPPVSSAPKTPSASATAAAPGPSIDIGAPLNDAIPADAPTHGTNTYQKDDLIGAAEGVFGKGAAGLATMISDLLEKQGEPNGYIVGREGSGAFILGLRYGSGTLHHKIEGTRPVYWTGPSVGIDAGANAASSFVLVYNLFDTEDLFKRFGAGEGQAYLVGGFHVSYLRRGDIVLIPVRSGAGLRLGLNAGYMKFTPKKTWLPF